MARCVHHHNLLVKQKTTIDERSYIDCDLDGYVCKSTDADILLALEKVRARIKEERKEWASIMREVGTMLAGYDKISD